jgi:hypothetical protein
VSRISSRRLDVSDADDGVDLGAKKIGTRIDGSRARRKQTAAVFRSMPPNEVRAKGKLETKIATPRPRKECDHRYASGDGIRSGLAARSERMAVR